MGKGSAASDDTMSRSGESGLSAGMPRASDATVSHRPWLIRGLAGPVAGHSIGSAQPQSLRVT